MYKTLEELNSYMSKIQEKDPKKFDKALGTIQQRAKDKFVFMSGKTTQELLDERNYWLDIKGARNKSVNNRITRLESVLVARYDRDKREVERLKKQAEG
jgi:hypothetical protein|tara:strand:- start:340 stop:636 length:297 start_codon:yes stop_codon:yes gene_type:complete